MKMNRRSCCRVTWDRSLVSHVHLFSRGSASPLVGRDGARSRFTVLLHYNSSASLGSFPFRVDALVAKRGFHSLSNAPLPLRPRSGGPLSTSSSSSSSTASTEAMIRWYAKQKQCGVLFPHDVPRLTKALLQSNDQAAFSIGAMSSRPTTAGRRSHRPSQQAACLAIGAGQYLNGPHDPTPEYVHDIFLSLPVKEKEALAVFFFSRGLLPSGLSVDEVLHALLAVPRACVIPRFLRTALLSDPSLLARVHPRYLRRCLELALSPSAIPSTSTAEWAGAALGGEEPNAFKKRWIAWGEEYLPDHKDRCEVLRAAGLCFEALAYEGHQQACSMREEFPGVPPCVPTTRRTFLQTPSISDSTRLTCAGMWEPPREACYYTNGGFGPEVIAVLSQPSISVSALRKCCEGMPPLVLEYTMQIALQSWARRRAGETKPASRARKDSLSASSSIGIEEDFLSSKALREKNSVPHWILSSGHLTVAQLVHTLHFSLQQGSCCTAMRLLPECRTREEISVVMQYTRAAGVSTVLSALDRWRHLFPNDAFYIVLYLKAGTVSVKQGGRARVRNRDELEAEERSEIYAARLVIQLASPSDERENDDDSESVAARRTRPGSESEGYSQRKRNDGVNSAVGVLTSSSPSAGSELPQLFRAMTSFHGDMVSWSISRLIKQREGGLEEALSVLSIALERGERPEFAVLVDLLLACAKRQVLHSGSREMCTPKSTHQAREKHHASLHLLFPSSSGGPFTSPGDRPGEWMSAITAILQQHCFQELDGIFHAAFEAVKHTVESRPHRANSPVEGRVLVELVHGAARCGCFDYPAWLLSTASAAQQSGAFAFSTSSEHTNFPAASLREALRSALLQGASGTKVVLHRQGLDNVLQLSAALGFDVSADVFAHDVSCSEEMVRSSCCWWWSSEDRASGGGRLVSGISTFPLPGSRGPGRAYGLPLTSVTDRLYKCGLVALWPLSVSEVRHRVQQEQHYWNAHALARSSSELSALSASDPSGLLEQAVRNTVSSIVLHIHKAVRLAALGCEDAPSFFTVMDAAQEWLGQRQIALSQHSNTRPSHRGSSPNRPRMGWAATRIRAVEDAQLVRTILCAVEMLRQSGNVDDALRLLPPSVDLPLCLQLARQRCLESDPNASPEALKTVAKHVLAQQQKESKQRRICLSRRKNGICRGRSPRATWCRMERKSKKGIEKTNHPSEDMPKRLSSLMRNALCKIVRRRIDDGMYV